MNIVRKVHLIASLTLLTWIGANNLNAMAYTAQDLCSQVGGSFLTLTEEETSLEICQFRSAAIEATTLLDFYERDSYAPWPEAIDAFAQRRFSKGGWGTPESVCLNLEGDILSIENFDFCVFCDESIIELKTLFSGVDAKDNAGLKKAIELAMGGE